MSGRTARWLLQLNEFDIIVITPRWLLSQTLSDLLAQYPSRECKPLHDLARDWILFDGSSTYRGARPGVVL